MNARLRPGDPARPDPGQDFLLRDMTASDLDAIMRIETAVYPFPWSRGNFADSLTPQYVARVLVDADGEVAGYFIAMPGVEEMHLLNVSLAPQAQQRGLSLLLLDSLLASCRDHGAQLLWLEVRPSNTRALHVYEQFGFYPIARRRDYYPSTDAQGRTCREDALVMSATVADLLRRRGLAAE